MRKNLVIALAMLLLANLACNLASITGGSATKQPANVLFKDDFSDPASGWFSLADSDGITDYDEGFYRIRVDTIGSDGNGMDMWSRPDLNLEGDISIAVDATKIGGPDENVMGVMCRYSKINDAYNFYYFMIGSDGYVAIAKMKDSNSELISGEEMTPSDAINTTITNHIRADCIGDTLTLYVNDTKVATATDGDFTGGDVGLIAGTFSEPGVDIHFDNFIVTKP